MIYRVFARYFLALLILCPGNATSASESPVIGPIFNREAEFPNYFLPLNFNQLSANQKQKILAEIKFLLAKAVGSKFKRLLVPVSIQGKIQNVRYFDYIGKDVAILDKTASVMPSGGLVRSMLGDIYEEVFEYAKKNPQRDPLQKLREIASDTRDIKAIEIRGVGGDFDVLIKSDPSKFDAIKEKVEQITNSAEDSLGARQHSEQGVKRLLFTVGDVKPYEQQTKRSTAQGGSAIDFLAFDQNLDVFVEPDGHNYIVYDFLQGYYRYLAPEKSQSPENFQKQVVRGIRPLLELPFLDLHPQSASQFETELGQLIQQLKKNNTLDPKALEQIGKAIRNGRRSLGNNRVIRAATQVEKLIRELSDELGKRNLEKIPEYVDSSALDFRDIHKKNELNGLPRAFLTPAKDFISQSSARGKLFHGTPTLDNAMAIMRGGLYYSGGRNRQGRSDEGGGGYSATDPNSAKKFDSGLLLELKIKEDPRINILPWNWETQHWCQENKIAEKATALHMDMHQYLQRYHGIDLIALPHGVVLIQNMEALDIGKPHERINIILESLRNGNLDSLVSFKQLRDYANGLGLPCKDIGDPDWTRALELTIKHKDYSQILRFIHDSDDILKKNPQTLLRLIEQSKSQPIIFEALTQYGSSIFQHNTKGLENLIESSGEFQNDSSLQSVSKNLSEVLKAHLPALTKFSELAASKDSYSSLQILLKAYGGLPEEKIITEIIAKHMFSLRRALHEDPDHRDLRAVRTFARLLESSTLSKNYRNQIDSACKKAIEAAQKNKDYAAILTLLDDPSPYDKTSLQKALDHLRVEMIKSGDFLSLMQHEGYRLANPEIYAGQHARLSTASEMKSAMKNFMATREAPLSDGIKHNFAELCWRFSGAFTEEILPDFLKLIEKFQLLEALAYISTTTVHLNKLNKYPSAHVNILKNIIINASNNNDLKTLKELASYKNVDYQGALIASNLPEISETFPILVKNGHYSVLIDILGTAKWAKEYAPTNRPSPSYDEIKKMILQSIDNAKRLGTFDPANIDASSVWLAGLKNTLRPIIAQYKLAAPFKKMVLGFKNYCSEAFRLMTRQSINQ